jgi:hypothetical protein
MQTTTLKPVEKISPPYSGAPDPPAETKRPALKVAGALKEKPVKVTKTKAAELKEALEKRQLGDTSPVKPKLDGNANGVKFSRKGKAAKPTKPAEQLEIKIKVGPPKDKIGKAAVRLKKAVDELDSATDEKGAAVENLVKAMQKANGSGTRWPAWRLSWCISVQRTRSKW